MTPVYIQYVQHYSCILYAMQYAIGWNGTHPQSTPAAVRWISVFARPSYSQTNQATAARTGRWCRFVSLRVASYQATTPHDDRRVVRSSGEMRDPLHSLALFSSALYSGGSANHHIPPIGEGRWDDGGPRVAVKNGVKGWRARACMMPGARELAAAGLSM